MLINIIRENIAMGKDIAIRENIAVGSRHVTTSDGVKDIAKSSA